MIRVIFFLVVVALLAIGAAWLADRPGEIAITWLGWRIETSVFVGLAALAIVVVIALLLWSLVRTILRSPDLIAMYLNHRRGVRGYRAVSRGLIAIGAGDARAARKAADEVARIAPSEPLALLLNAQNAQLSGDPAAAEAAFRTMTERDDTRLLGLRGLYIEAQRRKDPTAAQVVRRGGGAGGARAAWASQAVLDFRCAAGDWAGALSALDRNSKNGLIDKADYRRQRAVLLTARALAAEESDRDQARSFALDAVKLAPTLVPAAELAGRLLGESGELRRASRIIEKAWQANPHPDLAETYAHLRPGDSARDRLARVQALADKTPGNPEGALAVARAALDAQEFAVARAALAPLLREPTQRAAELMAEIEQRENGDEGRAREWMARACVLSAARKWTADGIASDRWMPVSPVSGRLDAFQWRGPAGRIGRRARSHRSRREAARCDAGVAERSPLAEAATASPLRLPRQPARRHRPCRHRARPPRHRSSR